MKGTTRAVLTALLLLAAGAAMATADALKQFGHDSLVGWIKVLDDDERQAAALRHVPQEQLQGLQSAGRRAKAHECARRVRVPYRGKMVPGPNGEKHSIP